jgi:hypothetical protein
VVLEARATPRQFPHLRAHPRRFHLLSEPDAVVSSFVDSLASADGAFHSARCEEIVSLLSASEVTRDESVLLADHFSPPLTFAELSLETSACVLLLNWCVLPLQLGLVVLLPWDRPSYYYFR